MSLERPVTELSGVGPAVAGRLAALGIRRQLDLLLHRPLRYEDRTRIIPLARLRPGGGQLVEGRIVEQEIRRGRRRMLVAVLADDTGQVVLRFFNFYPSQTRQLAVGNRVRCFGEVRPGYEGLEMAHPNVQGLRGNTPPPLPETLSPIYPTTAGLAQGKLARLITATLDRLQADPDLLPPLAPELDTEWTLPAALACIHHPPPDTDLDALIDGHHPAVQRLVMEELTAHHAALRRVHRQRATQSAEPLPDPDDLAGKVLAGLPFKPTGAQQRVIDDIRGDVAGIQPMRRLLQGDVGSGKTVVAAWALARAAGSGRQAAVIAPTEILAEQHAATLSAWLEPLGIETVLLTGRLGAKPRREALAALATTASVAIGTHALFQEEVAFRDLALVVVDEQHRFGVHQRLALAGKGARGDDHQPHQLIMTATPIPRTLAMTTYAGLDVSVLDELPPGRLPVTTVALSNQRRQEVVDRIRGALNAGRQAYWVCTLIDDSETLAAEAAGDTAEALRAALPEFTIGLVHGRLKPADKTAAMADFADGQTRLLVATTVIEVGVDVPNASLMIIENPERLGLAQLHQLRGRIGRGSEASACVLLYQPPLTEMARRRLEVMRSTGDGFVIAEQDLELRGPGELLGTRQTGMLRFRVADLARDSEQLDRAAALAGELERNHPGRSESLIERWIGRAVRFAEA